MYKPFKHFNNQIAASFVSAPAPVLPTPDMWLDASQLSGSEGDNITSWPDETGNGYDYTASSTGPELRLEGLNGYPALRFSSTTSKMARSQAGNFETICIVYYRTSSTGSLYRNQGSSTYRAEFAFISSWFGYTGFAHRGISGGTDGYLYSKTDMPVDTNLIMIATTDGTFSGSDASKIYIDDSAITISSTDGFGLNVTAAEIGGADLTNSTSTYYKGYIAEVIGYQRVLNATDRAAVNDYLTDKYGLDQPVSGWDISLFSTTASKSSSLMTPIIRDIQVNSNSIFLLTGTPSDYKAYDKSDFDNNGTLTFDQEIATINGSPRAGVFYNDAYNYMTADSNADEFDIYTFTAPYSLSSSTGGVPASGSMSALSSIRGMSIVGDYIYFSNSGDSSIYQASWDGSNIANSAIQDSLSVTGAPQQLQFNPNGRQFIYPDFSTRIIYQYDLGVPNDVTTATLAQTLDLSSAFDYAITAVWMDGSYLYVGGSDDSALTENYIKRFDLI
jgi:hypothetical protein